MVRVKLSDEVEDSEMLDHPSRCVYLFGTEYHGSSEKVIEKNHFIVKFKSQLSLSDPAESQIACMVQGIINL